MTVLKDVDSDSRKNVIIQDPDHKILLLSDLLSHNPVAGLLHS